MAVHHSRHLAGLSPRPGAQPSDRVHGAPLKEAGFQR